MRAIATIFQGEALEKAKSDLNTSYELIDRMYPGPWTIKDQQLFKGAQLINGNTEIVDLIGKLTNGDTATLFLGDTRVTTNVFNGEKRAVGTQASAIVVEKVLKAGEYYIGTANVAGHTYQAAYMPIKDEKGVILGMWYVGAPDASERIQDLIQTRTYELQLIAIIVIIASIILNFVLIRPILRRIGIASRTLQQIADKDLTQNDLKITSQDESGRLMQSVNGMVHNLRSILSQINDTAVQLAAASEQLHAGAEQSSQAAEHIAVAAQRGTTGAEQQLNSIYEASNAMSQFSTSFQQFTVNSEEVSNLADSAYRASNEGVVAVTALLAQMDAISSTVQETSGFIKSLGDRSQEIEAIVTIITTIANQTNLLSLNAGIEAAHAGDMGKGFAVVASEVRKLAEQSGNSAQQIKQLIDEIQLDMERATSSMQQGTSKVAEGMTKTLLANKAFDVIQQSVSNVKVKVQEVASDIGQMSAGSQQIEQSIDTIHYTAQEGASVNLETSSASEQQLASLEEITASSRSLAVLAEELHSVLGKFKLQ
ncbi:methyl-accepting chemotaxis protein [Paenibacillus sp. WQ 127069]|uniref:Methyl-accepting chemotaxis protein n=1 Tax=Paenibacillus baimaensis TaxID=2982185 RepID=A0ABT2URP7_9BACL|nr:methyl-accepting chemotaxis protein [Paenibacillus sp. WQ 127069]MCU6796691.1 methyl-accepting chemotaxis protein [Paenibacillus sp. WQ 127069]